MIDWTESMRQSFEYYVVDPYTWHDVKEIRTVRSCSITRDASLDTLGNASLDCDENLNDKYVRAYLIATQHGETQKIPLGTHIYQTPNASFDGKRIMISHDGYTPLVELKEKTMPVGFAIRKNTNVLDAAYTILLDNSLRAPVVMGTNPTVATGDFLSDVSETRLSYVSDLLKTIDYSLGIDELGKIIFIPDRDLNAMQPIWEYTIDDESILYPDFSTRHDIFGIPNKIEVIFSPTRGTPMIATDENTDESSIVSYQARGRWIVYRETDPDVFEGVTQGQLNMYAHKRLMDLSSIDYEITYKHGYCPVRLGDCVRFNYNIPDLKNKNGKVVKQTIRCEEGCPVEETAVLTSHLWEGEV